MSAANQGSRRELRTGGIWFDEDWAARCEVGLGEYLERLEYQAMGVEDDSIIVSITGEPYCGCSQCLERETMAYFIRATLEGAADGHVGLLPD